MRRLIGVLALGALIIAASTTPVSAAHIAYRAALRPASVVTDAGEPGVGDPDGFANSSVTLDPATGEVCFVATSRGITAPTAAAIHAGADGSNGPAVVDLPTPSVGRWTGQCVTVDPAIIAPVIADPTQFYVLITTAEYPDGAIRGQLSLLFCTIHATTAEAGTDSTDLLYVEEGETATVFGRFAVGAQVVVTAHRDGVLVSSEIHEALEYLETSEGRLIVQFAFADGDDGEWTITVEDPAVGDCHSSATINVADTLPAFTPAQPLPDTAVDREPSIPLPGLVLIALVGWAATPLARPMWRRGSLACGSRAAVPHR